MPHSEISQPGNDETRETLTQLLRDHTVVALATADDQGPYAAPLFYVPVEDGTTLAFISDPQSTHVRHVTRDARVAAAIYRDPQSIAEIRGVQLRGRVTPVAVGARRQTEEAFLQRFPEARAALAARPEEQFYRLRISWAKITDNRRGFGHKMVWVRP